MTSGADTDQQDDDLARQLGKLPKLFARMDSPEENESFAALKKVRNSFAEINRLTGNTANLNFAEFYRRVDQSSDIDPADHQRLIEENEQLYQANQAFAKVEEGYKQNINALKDEVKAARNKRVDDIFPAAWRYIERNTPRSMSDLWDYFKKDTVLKTVVWTNAAFYVVGMVISGIGWVFSDSKTDNQEDKESQDKVVAVHAIVPDEKKGDAVGGIKAVGIYDYDTQSFVRSYHVKPGSYSLTPEVRAFARGGGNVNFSEQCQFVDATTNKNIVLKTDSLLDKHQAFFNDQDSISITKVDIFDIEKAKVVGSYAPLKGTYKEAKLDAYKKAVTAEFVDAKTGKTVTLSGTENNPLVKKRLLPTSEL